MLPCLHCLVFCEGGGGCAFIYLLLPFWVQVVLCGGGARMPLVQRVISDFFPASEQLTSVSGDEVIAIGAAKEVLL